MSPEHLFGLMNSPVDAADSPSVGLRKHLARRCLQAALALCLAGVVLAFLATWGERRATAAAAWHNPADDLRAADVAPDLALLSLAGVSDERVLTLAMEATELETVRAVLTFSGELTDLQRINGWLWLAYRYQEAAQPQRAAQAYRLAGGGAILSPHLSDFSRTETLLTTGRQLIALHDASSAHLFLGQAALIGAYAPNLTDYYRHSLLEQLIPTLLQAGGQRDDWNALSKALQGNNASGSTMAPNWHSVAPGQDAALVAAQDARRAAAAALLAALSRPQTDESRWQRPPGELGQAIERYGAQRQLDYLRQALLTEDLAVAAYLQQHNGLSARETRLRWLWLKRRLAAGGVGAGLMPEWEAQRKQIDQALTDAWTDRLALVADSIHSVGTGAEPDASKYIDPGGTGQRTATSRQATQAARQAITAAHWGLYPQAPIEQLISLVQRTGVGAHWANGSQQLYLSIVKTGTPPLVGWREQTDQN